MQNFMEGFITYVDETGSMKTLVARKGSFSIIEDVSEETAKEILDQITTGRYRWLRFGQRKVGALR
jgi:protein involved in temperature-dependent protein secretion